MFEATPSPRFYNPLGTVHGGWISTLLDSAMGCAVHSVLKAGQAYTTVDMTVSFVRPVFEKTGKLRCEGKIIHAGSRIATAEGRVWDQAGTLIAHGSETCMVMAVPGTRSLKSHTDIQFARKTSMQRQAQSPALPLWLLILIVGIIVGVSMGRTQSMGLYLPPVTKALDIGREPFGLAMALAQLHDGHRRAVLRRPDRQVRRRAHHRHLRAGRHRRALLHVCGHHRRPIC